MKFCGKVKSLRVFLAESNKYDVSLFEIFHFLYLISYIIIYI